MTRLTPALLALLIAATASATPLRVSDRAGKAVGGAVVRSLADPAAATLKSDSEGLLDAPEGLLRIEAEGFLPWEGSPSATVVLTRPSRIVVRAIDGETGVAADGGRLRLWAIEGEASRAEARGGTDAAGPLPEGPPLQEVTLLEGRASIGGLASGSYRVELEADGFLSSGRAVAPAPESGDEITLRLMPASVVEGRVLRGGKAVAGARLRVLPGLPEQFVRGAERLGPGGGAGGRGGGEMMRALSALTEREVRTDELGRFRFDQLPAERRIPFLLVAQAPDFSWGFTELAAASRGGAPLSAEERTIALDVILVPGTTVTGQAIWSGGEKAVGVSVVAELEQEMRGFGGTRRVGVSLAPLFESWGGGPEDVTGPEGVFTIRNLPPARWRFVARPLDHAASDPLELELIEGAAAPAPVAIQIQRGQSIEGLVVGPSGTPVAGAEVIGTIFREGGNWPEQRLDTTTDAKGRFKIAGLDQGLLTLQVRASGFGEKSVELGQIAELGQVTIELTRTGRLHGLVLNAASGEPLTRFRVVALRAEEDGDSSAAGRFRGGGAGPELVSEDGSFELEEIEEGRWAVLVRADGYLTRVSEPVEVRASELSDVGRVELAPGAVVVGRVEDGGVGGPVVGATVTVQGLDEGGAGRFRFQRRGWGNNSQAPSDTSDAEGAFRLDGLPPGEFTVSATHHSYPVRAEHSQRISVGEDPSASIPPLVLKMELGGSISGRVLDASGEGVAGAVVVAMESDPRGRGSVLGGPVDADEAGAFLISALPAGELTVRRSDRMDGGVKALVRKGEVTEVILSDSGVRVFGGIFVSGRPVEARVRLLAGTWGAPRTEWGKTYQLDGVPAGEWTLRVDLRDEADPTAHVREERVSLTVPADLSELQRDIRLEAEDTSDDVPVEGRVVDVDTGEGLEGWLITARADGGQRETSRSDATGTFRITLTESGPWRVSALSTSTDPPYDPPVTVVLLAENGRLQGEPPLFEAKRRLEVKVRVVDIAGSPLAGASCSLINRAQHLTPQGGLQAIGPRGTSTDALGRTVVSASEAGAQDLLVVLPSRAFLIRTGVQVGSAAEVEVQVPHTGTLEIRGARSADLLDLPGGWWMKLVAGQNRYGLLEMRGDSLLMHGLPAGGYRVRVEGEERSVEVVPGTSNAIVDFRG